MAAKLVFLRSWQAEVISILLLSLYVFFLLNITDRILLRLVPFYQTMNSYGIGVCIFFIVSYFFLQIGKKYQWNRFLHYFLGSLGVFFPLVVISSVLRVKIGLPESVEIQYQVNYCDGLALVNCGKAFAHIVYSMVIRATPAVLTVPSLYWYLVVRHGQSVRG